MTERAYLPSARYPAAHDVGADGLPACDAPKQIDAEPGDWRVVPVEELPDRAHRCGQCNAGAQQPNNGQKIVSDLQDTSPEELGLSPMGDRP